MAESGWRAECQDCPTTIGGYGEIVRVHREFAPDQEADAHLWALHHSDSLGGHTVYVTHFSRWEMQATEINPDLWHILFDHPETTN